MRYVFPSIDVQPHGTWSCRAAGHAFPSRFPLWRRLLRIGQTCPTCKTRRYWN